MKQYSLLLPASVEGGSGKQKSSSQHDCRLRDSSLRACSMSDLLGGLE
jgi:hypothetical protein